MRYTSSLLGALCVTAALQAQTVAEIPTPILASTFIDMDLLTPGPVTLAQVNAVGAPAGGLIANLTATPNTAAPGTYSTNANENGLCWQGGVLSVISLTGANGTAFDAVDVQIDLMGPSTEIGFGITDWVGGMIVDFYMAGTLVTTHTTSTYNTSAPKIFQMTGGAFDRVDVKATTTGGNWTLGDFYVEPSGSGTVLSTLTSYGTGCVSQPDISFYENFAGGTFDLVAPVDSMTLLKTGGSYLAMSGLASYVAPTPAATALSLGDDAETQVSLSAPLPYGAANSTTSLMVCSNGFVSTGSNGTSYSPNVSTMLNNANTGWYTWHDYNPTAGGTVWFEEVGGIAYVTWDNVPSYGQTVGEVFQFQFELATGNISIVWVSISNLGNDHLVGFSEGGTSADPGGIDLSSALPGTIPNAAVFRIDPLAFSVTPRPIINTAVSLTANSMNSSTIFGAFVIGLNQLPAPFDLTPLGMAGRFQYTDQLFNLLFFPAGANSASVPLTIPNMMSLNLHAQAFSYDPASGLTSLGAISSNAIHMSTGDY